MRGQYWTQADIDMVQAYMAEGKKPAEIARLIGRSKSEVAGICYRIREAKAAESERVTDSNQRRRKDDWGPGFWGQDVKVKHTTPRHLHAPLNHTAGGVARYGA